MHNPYVDVDGAPVVCITRVGESSVSEYIEKVLIGLGGLDRAFCPEDRILIKPNINSFHDAPAAVDPQFLAAFIDVLKASGYQHLAVAESSGRNWAPTSKVIEKKGLLSYLQSRDVPFHDLDDAEMEEVSTGGDFLPRVHLPTLLQEFDRLIFLPNLKTHGNTGFTLTVKLAMGLTPQSDRALFHRDSVAGAIADLARVVSPDLSLIDGRTAFVAGGPAEGTLARPGVLIASADPVACDVEAVRILLQHGAREHIGVSDPYDTETIQRMSYSAPKKITVRWI